MADEKTKLTVIDGETLMDMKLPPIKFCVDTLLPQGLCILGGASKIGKSWWVLDLCVRIVKGEPMWDLKTTSGTTLYLCLEDTLRRVQNRLLCITDEVPPNAFFATSAGTLSDGLCEQIRDFVKEHSDTVFVAVDTFQIVRNNSIDTSYANDYEEMRILKRLADELGICLLLVYHLRKQGDSDPFNKLTGTTGIVGAVDTAFVLDKSRRNADSATLYCTGRDVEDRQLELRFSKEEFVWKMLGDSMENREMLLPKEMEQLVDFMKTQKKYSGSNTEFCERYNEYAGQAVSARGLKRLMNLWEYRLADFGVRFRSPAATAHDCWKSNIPFLPVTKVPLVTVKSVYPQSVRPKRSFRPCWRFTGDLCRFRRGVGINRRCAGNNANSGRLRERRFYRFPGHRPGQAERPAVLAETPLFTGGSPNPLNLETESDNYE